MNGGDRMTSKDFKRRREALGITADRFYRMAQVSRRALSNAENGTAGPTVTAKVERTLARLEAGEDVPEDRRITRIELRPGVYVTVDADDAALVGDVREIEAKIRRLIDGAE